jgi:transposase-like protein
MKIVDTKSDPGAPFRFRINRTGRRTYSREYKLEVVQECSARGASLAAIALSHRINANLVRRWVVQHRAGRLGAAPMLLPVTVAASGALNPATYAAPTHGSGGATAGLIEIELDCARIRVRGAVDDTALRTVLDVLVKR